MSIYSRLSEKVLDGSTSLSDILRLAQVLALRLGVEEIGEWARNELDGYESKTEVPGYRKIYTAFQGNFLTPYQKLTDYNLSAEKSEYYDQLQPLPVLQGVRELESLAAADRDPRIPLPPVLGQHLALESGMQPRFLVSAYQVITRDKLQGLLDSIRNKLLNFLLALETERPEIIDSDDALSDFPTPLAAQYFVTIVSGNQQNISGGTITVLNGGDPMVSLEVAALTVNSIGSLASVIQAWYAQRQDRATRDPEAAEDLSTSVSSDRSQAFSRETISELSQAVDDDTLDTIRQNIEKAKVRLNRALRDPANTNQDKDNEVEKAAATVCAELSRLRRLNEDQLPEEFEKIWRSHKCA